MAFEKIELFMVTQIGKLVSMYTEAWISTLQVLYNNSYTALNLVCSYANLNGNLLFYPEIKDNSTRAMHGFIQELIQAHN